MDNQGASIWHGSHAPGIFGNSGITHDWEVGNNAWICSIWSKTGNMAWIWSTFTKKYIILYKPRCLRITHRCNDIIGQLVSVGLNIGVFYFITKDNSLHRLWLVETPNKLKSRPIGTSNTHAGKHIMGCLNGGVVKICEIFINLS